MLVSKKNRQLLYTQLFKDGVMTAKKDAFLKKHPSTELPNIQVMKMMQSLRSRGFVEETFSWQHYYWRLTNAGVEYLQEYLHLGEDVVPNTHKRTNPSGEPENFEAPNSREDGRGGYRGGEGESRGGNYQRGGRGGARSGAF